MAKSENYKPRGWGSQFLILRHNDVSRCYLLQSDSLQHSTPDMISPIFTISFLAALSSVVAVGPAAVNLGTAANLAILAESGITTVAPSVITGAVAISPIAATAMTGFSLILDSSGQFSTSSQVVLTPATLTMAVADMGTAYSDAMGRANPNFLNLAGAWIFQMIGTLNIATGIKMTLTGGALAKNIVWVALGAITAGTGSHFEGVILKKTGITLQTGATANSRLLAQTLVALQQREFKKLGTTYFIIPQAQTLNNCKPEPKARTVARIGCFKS
ncbi:hypothetical protein C8R44DRAFT_851714 [Mycena epipterygia]|nr:hypothetical protein C8R44DRAFT_851714 [Mycena epipterygia]